MLKIINFPLVTFYMAILFLPILSFSQISNEKYINIQSSIPPDYTESQIKKINSLTRNNLHKSVQFVKLGNFSKLVSSNKGFLPIQIPGSSKIYLANPVDIEYYSESDYKWVGKINSDNGEVIIICKNDEIFGQISFNSRIFEIQSLGKGKNILIELDNTELEKYKCGSDNSYISPQILNEVDKKSSLSITSQSNIRILVMYTDNANNAVSNITNTATLAISQINAAFNNSSISSNLSVSLAGVSHLNFTETNDIFEDISNLAINLDAQNLRDINQADLVVLLTDGNYADYYGISNAIGPNESFAYALLEADQATGAYTFAHEIGHLFGGHHENDNQGSLGYDHGYHFLTGIWPFRVDRRTIMHTLIIDSRILYYSNPNVTYKNKPTGNATNNNVARRIRETAPVVEAFRTFTPPLTCSISGPTFGYNSGVYTWYSNVNSGMPPYTYRWDYGFDGINYNGTLGYGANLTAPLPLDYNLYLRLTVNSMDGQQAIDFHTIKNLGDDPNPPIEIMQSQKDSINFENISIVNAIQNTNVSNLSDVKIRPIDWTIYPNPFSNETTIIFISNFEDTKILIDILDSEGKIVRNITNQFYKKGFNSIILNSMELASGTYICRISQGIHMDSKIIIKY